MFYVIRILLPNGNKITKSILAVSARGAMNLAMNMYPQGTEFVLIDQHGE